MSDKGAILVVDDTHASLKLLTDLLKAEGYAVHPADSGELALASVAANPPDLILLDIRMPGMDGFEVFRRLKARQESCQIPVIFISALTEMEQRVEGLKLGALDFISKPFQREELLARVQTHMELSQLRTRLEQMVLERTRELEYAHEQLVRQERLATLGQMAGSISHELRNPLGIISNAIYYLKLVLPEAGDKVKEYLDIIERETRTSDKIITDLLNFAHVTSVDRNAVSASDLISQTLQRFPALPSVEVLLEIPTNLPPIFADPHHMVQVTGNLILNACQAMPEGGTLTISARAQDSMICVSFQDSGSGITPENMKKLFEPLFTTKAKGIGLGLAVSKKLVEANDGRIEVESEPGKGTTFTVFLPQESREK
jgi:signal transduction histidine kinase